VLGTALMMIGGKSPHRSRRLGRCQDKGNQAAASPDILRPHRAEPGDRQLVDAPTIETGPPTWGRRELVIVVLFVLRAICGRGGDSMRQSRHNADGDGQRHVQGQDQREPDELGRFGLRVA